MSGLKSILNLRNIVLTGIALYRFNTRDHGA